MADYTLSAKITGDSSGFEKAFSTAESAVENFSSRVSKISKSVGAVGNALTSKITMPAVTATSALTGITLVKGFNRLTGIDDAKAKLKGLGHDAESVEEIMNSALESVKGTSYGMDEAATTAAGAVAAGIKPGQELTKYLSTAADAAAIAGISMSEMGSIMNKVQTGQTAYTEDLNQLADRGLPIYQWLAEEAGVAASEVKKLASDGQISSEMLFSAIEKNIGGAAKTIGESSFTAAISNISASISRIGANFLDAGGKGGGFFSTLKPMLSDFNNKLGVLEERATELGVKFGEAFTDVIGKVSEVKTKFDSLSEPMQNMIIKGTGIGAAIAVGIGPALKVISGLMSGVSMAATVFGALLSPIGLIVSAIAGLAIGFVYLINTNQQFHDTAISIWDSVKAAIINSLSVLQNVFGALQTVMGFVVQAFQAFFSGLAGGFSSGLSSAEGFSSGFLAILGLISPHLKMILLLFQNFGPQIHTLVDAIGSSLVPVFTTLGATISGIVMAVMPALQSAMANLVPVIAMVITAVTQIITTILPVVISMINQIAPFLVQIAQMIGQIVASLAPMIAQLMGALLPVITNIVTVVMNVITAVMPALIAIINVVMSVIQALVPIITNILLVVVSVVSGIISAINPIISFIGSVISAIMSIVSPIVTFISNIIATIVRVIGTIIGIVTGIFSTVFSIISGVFTNVSNFVSQVITGVSTVISTLTGIVGSVFNGIYSTVSSVMSSVGSFIQGVFNGIKSAWNGLTSFVSGVFSGIGSAVSALVSTVKGFINGVIGGINLAVGLINKIPGVSISKIPYLLHGTDDWQGGFARMNEGGRGELTYLPDGTQVIPHDISVKYAKEAARISGASAQPDFSGILEGMTIQIINSTNVDGTPLRETLSDYVIEKIGNSQNAKLRSRGGY